jgi:Aerotolerance regulator N-terminal/von Willebrand factor type A domain
MKLQRVYTGTSCFSCIFRVRYHKDKDRTLTFLNPVVLFGLLSAAIPILLHVFNLRKLKTIEFSTLSFLKELQKTKIRRIKVRQWLLLLLRTLLILLVVFAFSRPTLKGSLPGAIAEQAKTTAVLIIDDSPSMTANDAHGELFKQATDAAVRVTNVFKDGDEAVLVKLSETRANTVSSLSPAQRNFSAVRSALHEMKPSFIHRTLDDALRYSAACMASSKNFNQEIYIFSDFKTGTIVQPPSAAPDIAFSPATQFFFLPLGERELQNISLDTIGIPNTIFEMNKPFTVKARITNHSAAAVHNHLVSIIQDGTRAAQKGFDLAAGQSTTIEFSITPKHTGFVNGMVELEDDGLEFDNRRYFTVDVPAEIRIALIGSSTDAHYIKLALNTQLADSMASLRLNETPLERLTTAQLSSTDVIVLTNPHDMDAASIEKLKMFVAQGGGLLLFPGAQTTVNDFNATLAKAFGISKMLPHEPQPSATESFVEFSKTDLRHPVFQGMFEEYDAAVRKQSASKQPLLESPRITQSVDLQPTLKSHAIITLSNGFPFLTEEQVGSGHILMFSVAAVPQWSDFPLKGLFVPLLHRSIAYLASPQTSNRSILTGDEYTSRTGKAVAERITIVKPNNEAVLLNTSGGGRIIRFAPADLPGNYTVKNGTNILEMFSTNIDPAESNTIRATDLQVEKALQPWKIPQNHIHHIRDAKEIEKTVLQVRLGTELWKHLLILALLVALAEMLVARETKKELITLYSHAE